MEGTRRTATPVEGTRRVNLSRLSRVYLCWHASYESLKTKKYIELCVARALSDRDTFERLRAALHDGAAAATASTPPTAAPSSDKSAVKRERDQALVERNATQQKYTLVISASRSHKSRNKRRKKNLADCAKRKYEQLHGDEMMKFLQNEKQLKVARVEIRRLTTENSTQRKRLSRFTSNKGGSRMKAHERTAALLRNDIKEKYLKIIRLEDEIAQLSALVKKNQATIDAIWLPTRGRGKGAGRGTGRGGGEGSPTLRRTRVASVREHRPSHVCR